VLLLNGPKSYVCLAITMAGDRFTDPESQDALLNILAKTDTQYAWPTEPMYVSRKKLCLDSRQTDLISDNTICESAGGAPKFTLDEEERRRRIRILAFKCIDA
jgi:hypothetical protein